MIMLLSGLGFEGRCVSVNGGKRRSHSLGMHPPPFSHAWAEFDIGVSKYRTLRGQVGVNDGNNGAGRAGSPLEFAIVDATTKHELWRSRGIDHTGDYADFSVNLEGVSAIRLEVLLFLTN